MSGENNENIRKILFDETENRPLLLDNGNGLIISFEQVFATEREDGIYCILRPLAAISGVTAQTAFVFSVGNDGAFRAVTDKKATDTIFAEYYKAVSARRKE